MSEHCDHNCEGCSADCGDRKACPGFQGANSGVKKVIGIVSGKGGVGKSLVTALLASALAKKGLRTAVLDADITGPSIPKMYGLNDPAEALAEDQILPAITRNGIKVMSLNLLMPNPEDPVIWRGLIIAGVVRQFWADVVWGELDYLVVDMPPGTGDVPLTVFQSLPVDGIFIVTSPQDLVKMIVTKALNMARAMKIPVLGVIENYSYLKCPDCGKIIDIFGKSKVDDVAKSMELQVGGKIPVDSSYAELADAGRFDEVDNSCIAPAIDLLRRMG